MRKVLWDRRMKRIFSLILSAALLLLFPASVFAHAGKTDANGGHFDLYTGEYHYHHGFPAHQHTDGYCPYNFADETDYGSGGSGGNTISSNWRYTASDLREASEAAYDDGYNIGYRMGKTDGYGIGYDDGLEEGQETGYQTGLEDGRKEQFQYYPIVIASICVISGIIILALIASRQKVKSDYKIEILDNQKEIQNLTLKYQKETEEHQKDRLEMKAAYEKLVDAQKQVFSSEATAKSAEERVKACEKFVAMFGGSAEEFFARQDAPERLAKMQADYLTLVYEASAIYLENKQRPAYKEAQRIRELKADTARYIERMKKAEYECDQLREQLRITKKVYSVSDHTET